MFRFVTFAPSCKKGKMSSSLIQIKSCFSVLVLAFLLTNCIAGDATKEATDPVEQQPVDGADEWLNNLIQQLRLEKAANPPAKIYRYTYKGQVVYYLSGRCCDIPSTL